MNEKWQLDHITNKNEEYNSAKLTYNANTNYSSLNLEFLYLQDKIYSYINVFAKEIDICSFNNKAKLKIIIDNQTYQTYETLLLGKQRISLTDETTNLIISSLLENKPVEIILNSFSNKIDPTHFSESYKKLKDKNNFFDKLVNSINF